MKKQHYMTRDERQQLEALYTAGIPVAKIARQLGFCRQTIYNEIKRGLYIHTCDWWDEVRYSAQKGQQRHDYMQTGKGRQLKIGNDRAYAEFLEKLIIQKRYSPAAALAAAKAKGFPITICTTTLYSYIENRVFQRLTNKHLLYKGQRKRKSRKQLSRIAHPRLPSIADRPEHIQQRSERGHWEMDLIIGKQNTHPVLLTLTERVTRAEIIMKLPNRKAETIRKAIDRIERTTPDFRQRFRSITTDNGSEFLQYELLRQSIHSGTRFDIWYCHSFAAWEKGTNENHNRMIRRFFPKGTDFSRITQKQVQAVQDWMNNYPRKILGWNTPAQMLKELAILEKDRYTG